MSNPSPARLADAGAAAIRERPLLMSGPMVRAILDGQKSQTRRVIMPQPTGEPRSTEEWARGLANGNVQWDRVITEEDIQTKADRLRGSLFPFANEDGHLRGVLCPYGQPGDRLWVRETFWDHDSTEPAPARITSGDFAFSAEERDFRIEYRATPWDRKGGDPEAAGGWKPSIHMPRWASRITLEITGVRVERLQDISREDCNAEGLWHASPEFRTEMCVWRDSATVLAELPRRVFGKLWDSINADRGYSWDANPWVWVIEFRRLSSTEPAHA